MDGHKKCRFCGSRLVAGENWAPSRVAGCDYQCGRCRQMYDDTEHTPRLRQRERDRYDKFAFARGECADHVANFGYNMPYSAEFRAVFQWDHRFGKKELKLTLNNFHRSMSVLSPEVNKCALVCANCHSLATQKGWTNGASWVKKSSTRIDYDVE